LTEETILLKNFKFFDLDNSGGVDKEEFAKAIEKAGIQFLNKQVKKKLLEPFFKFIDIRHWKTSSTPMIAIKMAI